MLTTLTLLAALTLGLLFVCWQVQRRGVDPRLAPTLARTMFQPLPAAEETVHVLLCVADHYEPNYGQPGPRVARARVETWLRDYPARLGGFRDCDGRPPRHSFFYPLEEYAADEVEALGELCRQGFGEVEVHLHHDNDTAENLHRTLADYKHLLAEQHGQLARHRTTGELAYGFIHGNWALCNSRPDGCWCGVNNELDILRDTGCYADFTMPSAPHPTQTRIINRLYYATDRPGRPRSHETGVAVGSAPQPPRSLMLMQGPLLLDWNRRKWGLVPRLENGCLQNSQPPTLQRLPLWLRARVQVPQRPDWYFVKLHAHGAPENAHHALLGEPMARFHAALAEHADRNPSFRYHYVTAREMYNLARAAEAGWQGSVEAARDFELVWNGDAARFRSAALPRNLGETLTESTLRKTAQAG